LEAKLKFGRFGFGGNRSLYRESNIDISDAFGNLFGPQHVVMDDLQYIIVGPVSCTNYL